MNKRQAKKAFKKKYGINPNKVEKDIIKIIEEEIPKILESFNKVLPLVIEEIHNTIVRTCEELSTTDIYKFLENISEENEHGNN